MARIRERLAALAGKLGLNHQLLAHAQRRYFASRKRAYTAHGQQVKAQMLADKLRAKGRLAAATRQDKLAARAGHVAFKNHARAQVWLGRIRILTQRVNGLEQAQAQLEARLKELKKTHGVTIRGNKVSGGTPRQRLEACMLASAAACASGKRPNFYSQAGAWDVDHCLTGEHYGERSDCSSWFTSLYKACGLDDPNGTNYTGGYTGTLGEHGKRVSQPKPGDAVLYGPYPHHHVEAYCGPGVKTVGHGSAPVDAGVEDLFGDGDYIFRSYV